MKYYYKLQKPDGKYFYVRSKIPIRNLKDATQRTNQPVVSISPSGLIPYLFNFIFKERK